MEKQAIQHIEQNAVAEVVGSHLAALNLPVVLTPEAYSLTSIEKYLPAPQRFRGTFRTRNVQEFGAYVNNSLTVSSVLVAARGFIDCDKMAAVAILDLGHPGNPGHGEHRAYLVLEAAPEYKSLLGINTKPLQQRDLAEWMEDWRDNLTAYPAGSDTPIDIKEAIAAVRALTVEAKVSREHAVGDMSASKSALESIDATSRGKTLPAFLHFRCAPYEEMPPRDFVLRLGVLTEATPAYKLRIIRLESHVDAMAQEFKALVHDALKDSVTVHVGTFAT